MTAIWANTNTFSTLSGNQPASKLDTNFSELAVFPVYASAVGGTANDIALTGPLNFASGSLTTGARVAFIAGANNTGAMTATYNGSPASPIQKGSLPVAANDVTSGQVYELYYNGVWQLQNPTQTEYFIAANTLAGATSSDYTATTITSAFLKYRISLVDLRVSGSPINLNCRLSQSATFRSGASDYQWANNRSTAAPAGANEGSTADSAMQLCVSASNGTTNGIVRTINGDIFLYNPAGAFLKTVKWSLAFVNNSGVLQEVDGTGIYQGVTSGTPSTAVDGIRIIPSAGTLTGTTYLYGVRGT